MLVTPNCRQSIAYMLVQLSLLVSLVAVPCNAQETIAPRDVTGSEPQADRLATYLRAGLSEDNSSSLPEMPREHELGTELSLASADEVTHGPSMEVASEHVAMQGCETCGEKRCAGVCTDPGHPAKPKRTMPGDVDRGDCPPLRYRMDDCERAGSPHCVAPWAKCSVDGKYSAWFVGGGAAFFRGRPRHSDEGTWGLDYNGLFGRANVWLNYTRGRNQGGEGAYETDGGPEPLSWLKHE